jgi:hypothetical protein
MHVRRIERLTVIGNSSDGLHERSNESNLALEDSSQLFPYIRLESLKISET